MLSATLAASTGHASTCAYVSSYHRGYSWSDDVERGLRKALEGQCDIVQFDMDSKRNKDERYKTAKALEIVRQLNELNPDILIAADDNAVKYLVVPYFRDADLPVVFCGVNWTIEEYGFPFRNVTGMVEVAPLRPMLHWASKLSGDGRRALFIGADTLSERKNLQWTEKIAAELGITIDAALVSDMQQWQEAILNSDSAADFIILGNNAGIDDWDSEQAISYTKKMTNRLTVTSHDWMLPYAMLGFVKIPEEQGAWAGKTARAILQGLDVSRIPIITNSSWELYENPALVSAAGLELPINLRNRAKKLR